MVIELDSIQTEFMDILAGNEMGMNRRGIIATNEDNFRIEEVMFSHIVRRKNMKKINAPRENTLIVAPHKWMNKWRKRIEQLSDNIPILFYEKGYLDIQHVLCDVIIITSFNALYNLKEQVKTITENNNYLKMSYWERIVLLRYSTNHYNTKKYTPTDKQFERLCKIKAPYRWCITLDSTQQCLAKFYFTDAYLLEQKSFGYSIEDCLKQERVDFLGLTPMMTHEDYMKIADVAANKGNMIQFSRNLWNAVFVFTDAFYIEHIKIHVESFYKLGEMFELICAGLTPSEAADLMRLWVDVEWNYLECDQDNFFISIRNMHGIIMQLENSITLIKKANINLIKKAVNHSRKARELGKKRSN